MADTNTEIRNKSQENFIVGNRVYILGPFDRSISSDVIPALVEMIDALKTEKNSVIEFYINSYGGYAAELLGLLTLIDMAKSNGIKIITYNMGAAYSCGSLLSVVGDYRYMYRYAHNLPHLGQTFLAPTTVEQLNREAKHAAEWFSIIYDIYSTYTKMPKKKLKTVLEDDNYFMNAQECLDNGFCDEII